MTNSLFAVNNSGEKPKITVFLSDSLKWKSLDVVTKIIKKIFPDVDYEYDDSFVQNKDSYIRTDGIVRTWELGIQNIQKDGTSCGAICAEQRRIFLKSVKDDGAIDFGSFYKKAVLDFSKMNKANARKFYSKLFLKDFSDMYDLYDGIKYNSNLKTYLGVMPDKEKSITFANNVFNKVFFKKMLDKLFNNTPTQEKNKIIGAFIKDDKFLEFRPAVFLKAIECFKRSENNEENAIKMFEEEFSVKLFEIVENKLKESENKLDVLLSSFKDVMKVDVKHYGKKKEGIRVKEMIAAMKDGSRNGFLIDMEPFFVRVNSNNNPEPVLNNGNNFDSGASKKSENDFFKKITLDNILESVSSIFIGNFAGTLLRKITSFVRNKISFKDMIASFFNKSFLLKAALGVSGLCYLGVKKKNFNAKDTLFALSGSAFGFFSSKENVEINQSPINSFSKKHGI